MLRPNILAYYRLEIHFGGLTSFLIRFQAFDSLFNVGNAASGR